MKQPIERLPDEPLGPDEVYELMEPPREGIGFSNPAHGVPHGVDAFAITLYLEYEGEIKGYAFDPPENEWVKLELPTTKFAEFMNDSAVGEAWMEQFEDKSEQYHMKYPKETLVFSRQTQQIAPAGFLSKIALPHNPLSGKEITTVTADPRTEYFSEVATNEDGKIIGIALSEVRSLFMEDTFVFLWFNPDANTWRIYDITPVPLDDKQLNFHKSELSEKIQREYDSTIKIV